MTVKRSVTIRGHRTSITVESEFWEALRAIADRRNVAVATLVARIDAARGPRDNLSSTVRLFVLRDALARAGGQGPVSPELFPADAGVPAA